MSFCSRLSERNKIYNKNCAFIATIYTSTYYNNQFFVSNKGETKRLALSNINYDKKKYEFCLQNQKFFCIFAETI